MCNQQIQLRARYVGNMTKRDGIEATCPRTWIFTNLSELFLYYLWNGDLNYFWNHTVDFICTIYKFKYIYIYVCIFVHFQLAWKTSFLCFPNHKHFSNSFYLLSAKSFTSFHLQVLTDYQTGNSFFPYFVLTYAKKQIFLLPLLIHSYGRLDGNVTLDNLKEDPSSRSSRAIPAEGPDKSVIK